MRKGLRDDLLRQILVALERLHVVSAFKRGRLGDVALAQAALHLVDRLVFVLVHPAGEAVDEGCDVVDAVMQGKEPEINDTKTYNNEVKVVPSYLLTPYSVGKDDITKMLVDSGYIKAEDLQ